MNNRQDRIENINRNKMIKPFLTFWCFIERNQFLLHVFISCQMIFDKILSLFSQLEDELQKHKIIYAIACFIVGMSIYLEEIGNIDVIMHSSDYPFSTNMLTHKRWQ